eukprot:4191606-Pleurochrysis_carterae.AAC.3
MEVTRRARCSKPREIGHYRISTRIRMSLRAKLQFQACMCDRVLPFLAAANRWRTCDDPRRTDTLCSNPLGGPSSRGRTCTAPLSSRSRRRGRPGRSRCSCGQCEWRTAR